MPPVAVALAARGVATVRAPRVVGCTLAVVPELRVALADGPSERAFAPGVADVVRGRVVRAHDFRGRRPVDEDGVLCRHGRRARRRRGRRVGRKAAVPLVARPAAAAVAAAHERVPVRAPRFVVVAAAVPVVVSAPMLPALVRVVGREVLRPVVVGRGGRALLRAPTHRRTRITNVLDARELGLLVRLGRAGIVAHARRARAGRAGPRAHVVAALEIVRPRARPERAAVLVRPTRVLHGLPIHV